MDNISLSIDGKTVQSPEGTTILNAALNSGIYIPHLCHHPDLPSMGACRLCVVEIEGINGIYTSCTTPATEGMRVKTKTLQLSKIRLLAMELMLVNHPSECTSCPKYLNCELQSLKQYLGVSEGVRFKKSETIFSINNSNPLFIHDFSRCILCGRCVRACNDLRGVGVLSFIDKGNRTHIGITGNSSLMEAGCRFCGACAEVCPTGALRDYDVVLQASNRRRALVPCKTECPAGIDVPRYIRFIREKKYSEAVAVIREKVPFPAILGYICNHPCEAVCRHKELNQAIAIRELKRFAATHDGSWRQDSFCNEATGKRVAIIGSGPSGLTAAYYLKKLGHNVTIFESSDLPGGMMRCGIPAYRLPDAVLDNEIAEISALGVNIKTSTFISSIKSLKNEGYNAVLVAIGTQQGMKLDIPGKDLEGVLISIPFLRDVRYGKIIKIGERVVIIGGGNVAFDCARSALRLGAKEVSIACLENEDNMLATREEIAQGCREGIKMFNSVQAQRIIEKDGKASSIIFRNVETFSFNDDGQLDIEFADEYEREIPTDTIIFAIGQIPSIPQEFELEADRRNRIIVEYDGVSTVTEGVFAAGDVVSGSSSVIRSIASGRQASMIIDSFLGGNGIIEEKLAELDQPSCWLGPGKGFAIKKRIILNSNPGHSMCSFEELEPGYDEQNAQYESERCLQCDLRLKISGIKFWADYPNS